MRALRSVAAGAVGLAAVLAAAPPAVADTDTGGSRLPESVDGGAWPSGHVQGAALDEERGHMYFSFTDMLVKTDLGGDVLGTVTGLTGHLGDLDFNERDGRVYGSLEYKEAESFYIAVFDGDRITRTGMDAEQDEVMSTVYLEEVVEDYTADMDGDGEFDGNIGDTADHRYGSSGIDGVSFGPAFGKHGGKQLLTVAYGVYSNTERRDNDNQVLLQYDVSHWEKYERPLDQDAPHTSGPGKVKGKYFAHTGNTTYGVQNLEYDRSTGDWYMAVYKGVKEEFPNYSLYVVDGSKRPVKGEVPGQENGERGRLLSLRDDGLLDEATGVRGWDPGGEYGGEFGLVSLDDGRFYLVESSEHAEDGATREAAVAHLNRWTGDTPEPFTPVG